MKDLVINNLISLILKYNDYDETKIEELKYGLLSIYLLITKLIVVTIVSLIFGIAKEMIIFTLLFIPVRAVGFGLHATKSWICLITSILMFIGIPIISKYLVLPIYLRVIIGGIFILLMFKNSPADTHKRPMVNKNRRLFYKFISVVIAVIYVFLSVLITNNFVINCLLFSLLVQNILISPLVYKLFGMPYNNYKNFNMV